MANQQLFTTVILTLISLIFAGMLLSSPYQVWMVLAAIGLITGLLFKGGQRHVITGFAIGIALTLVREYMSYGEVVRVTAPVYLAGYLFAIATSLFVRTVKLAVMKRFGNSLAPDAT
ncbi:hypothetical protein QWZ13_01805 [Reinekea marina]|uniref:Uncharacterized protein n=1 Tax=Reinekea marina TaxID=1310421 RepID=A0ABV7WPI7_9GAMM|nr:hypothetical protein [Reinekea marina]MDN3647640.1 hypothetical protein [Reinekea marina]